MLPLCLGVGCAAVVVAVMVYAPPQSKAEGDGPHIAPTAGPALKHAALGAAIANLKQNHAPVVCDRIGSTSSVVHLRRPNGTAQSVVTVRIDGALQGGQVGLERGNTPGKWRLVVAKHSGPAGDGRQSFDIARALAEAGVRDGTLRAGTTRDTEARRLGLRRETVRPTNPAALRHVAASLARPQHQQWSAPLSNTEHSSPLVAEARPQPAAFLDPWNNEQAAMAQGFQVPQDRRGFDPKAMIRAMKKAGRQASPRATAQTAAIREQIRQIIDAQGLGLTLGIKRWRWSEGLQGYRIVGFADEAVGGGRNFADGTFMITREQHEGALELLRFVYGHGPEAANLDSAVQGLAAIVHEELHGYSKQAGNLSWIVKQPLGLSPETLIEEATNHAATLAILRAHFLRDGGARGKRIASLFQLPAKPTAAASASKAAPKADLQADYMIAVLNVIQAHTGWSWSACQSAFERASLAMKRDLPWASNDRQHRENFVNTIQRLTGEQREQISKALSQIDVRDLQERYERNAAQIAGHELTQPATLRRVLAELVRKGRQALRRAAAVPRQNERSSWLPFTGSASPAFAMP